MGGSCLDGDKAAVVKNGFKLVMGQNKGATELYNVAEDPSETTDLSAKMPDRVAELMAIVRQYNSTASRAIDRDPIDPRSDPRRHNGTWVPYQ